MSQNLADRIKHLTNYEPNQQKYAQQINDAIENSRNALALAPFEPCIHFRQNKSIIVTMDREWKRQRVILSQSDSVLNQTQ